MDHDSFINATDEERIAYVNGKLAAGEKYEDILAALDIEKKFAGQSAPYGLGLIKIGNEVKLKPGRGDNGFAW